MPVSANLTISPSNLPSAKPITVNFTSDISSTTSAAATSATDLTPGPSVTDDNLRRVESTENYTMKEWLAQAAKDDAVTIYSRSYF
ncbi:hypothetical protein BDD12DRAFT_880566 [Trichophaea hybrida]|nr:hypothetical protein BDD12DRAFT_880566 [Trichophaea hybrida]